jgi:hypothetical protein
MIENGESLWEEIVREKYKIKGGIANLKYKNTNSHVWNYLIQIKGLYLAGTYVKI